LFEVFENRVLGIFQSKKDKVTGEWRRLQEELNDLYSSPSIVHGDKTETKEIGCACSMDGEGHVQGFGVET
jgi:hypothetical protein